ncbi:MAG: ECF transporter S component [Tissierellia bacterium]|nr:ECF transporter S component [Tissierellia bacterium]
MNNISKGRSLSQIQIVTRTSILGVLAFVLMFLEFPLGFIAPPFIKMDISDVPALIGAFAMGPVVGITIELLKNLLHIFLKGTMTAGVGELSNFIIGSTFVAVSAIYYQRHKTYKGAVVALALGTLAFSFLAIVSNYFVVFPLYGKVMSMDAIIAMGTAVNGKVTSLWTMMIYSILPFNLLKGAVVSVVTLLVYKKASPFLHSR